MTDDIAVGLNQISKHYGASVAVDQLSLHLPKGQFASLLGPSGCGKTTTLRIVAGFEIPDNGTVTIEGNEVTHIPPHRRNFGMVFQNYALFPHLTVRENVEFGLKMRKVPRATRRPLVERALELVKLGTFASRYPKQLSGGQQQRVALARAIVFEPAVLLLDEPLGALDRALREEMQIEIRQLQRQLGITTIFVTHDQEEALTMSDIIAVMSRGRIEQIGTPAEIYERPRTAFVAGFIGASNILTAQVIERREGIVKFTALGSTVVLPTAKCPSGDTFKISVRPECLRLCSTQDGKPTYRVASSIYRGSNRQISLVPVGDAAHAVNVLEGLGRRPASIDPGDIVGLDCEDDSIVPLFPSDEISLPPPGDVQP
jgi:spermidine/putrescine ABC transporter ATP-binding subunit